MLSLILKTLLRYRTLGVLLILALLLKLASLQPAWVEKNYTYGLYPVLSKTARAATGWLPFSLGDLLYAAAGIGLFSFAWRTLKNARKTFSKPHIGQFFYRFACTFLIVYILFNTLWGLNYDRQGIARQLDLDVQPYTLRDVVQLTQTLQARLNTFAAQTDTLKRSRLDTTNKLFQKAISVYGEAAQKYPFLKYPYPSIKPSLYSGIGHYFGFTGYYNPFSGEAQIKTSVPIFLKPFVATHEMAHQLGYAKENEANFIAFLSSKQSGDVDVLYSLYYNLYHYAVREVYSRDSVLGKRFKVTLHPQVLRDDETLKTYFINTDNSVEPIIARFYNQYLKWNNQKSGVQTYNQVVALLIAYGKKFGWAFI